MSGIGPERAAARAAPTPGARSVSIQGANFAPITTGDHSPVTAVTLGALRPIDEVPPAKRPVGLTGPPRPLVGRARELARLSHAMRAGPGVLVQPLHGLGGIGKSALAAWYAWKHIADYTQVVWVNAESTAGIEDGLRALALALEPQLAVLPSEALVERATAWLVEHPGWLLVLDNVTAVSDVTTLMSRLGAGQGRFLITSRRATGWDRLGLSALSLDALEPGDALELLGEVIGSNPQDLDGGTELCAELGFLPLAIEQAGAYIRQNLRDAHDGGGVRAYLELLAAAPAELYAAGDEDTASERTIARIWNLTLDRLADTPLAGHVLRVLAWYAPDAIPLSLLQGLASERELGEMIGRLAAHSMITRVRRDPTDSDFTPSVSVHRLVQAVTRAPDPADRHRSPNDIDQARRTAAGLLDAALPDGEEPDSWAAWERLMPHVHAMSDRTSRDSDTPFIIHVFHRAGRFLYGHGDSTWGIQYLERALEGLCNVVGTNQYETLRCRNNLACAYESAGRLGKAIALYEQTAADTSRILGREHPEALIVRCNLAYAYRKAGRLTLAIPLLEQVTADALRVLGDDHPDTLAVLENLAGAYLAAGHIDRAIPLYERVIADADRILGRCHPSTLAFRNALGYAYQSSGEVHTAILMLEQVAADRVQVLGEDHPDSLASRYNLARAFEIAGDLEVAIPLFEAVLADQSRVEGDDHPDCLTTSASLAGAYEASGDAGRAIWIYEHTLSNLVRVVGDDHPDVLAVRNNLAGALRTAGELDRAITLYEHNAADVRRVLGEDNEISLVTSFNLAGAYQEDGKVQRAVALYEEIVASASTVLGADHPNTKLYTARLDSARRTL